jgi:hypothetical protein
MKSCGGGPAELRRGVGSGFGGESLRSQLGRNERNVFEIVSHLSAKPAVNPQRGLVDVVLMSRVADCAFGVGLTYSVLVAWGRNRSA